jgi:RNA recognition motif-containing protein
VYVGRDRETGAGKGFAFVSFEDRANAQKAMEKVNGLGYDNLILSVQWSRKSINLSFLIIAEGAYIGLRAETGTEVRCAKLTGSLPYVSTLALSTRDMRIYI